MEVSTNSKYRFHKRRRIEVACTSCRRRKSRCDGQRPTCTACRNHGASCKYENATVNCSVNSNENSQPTSVRNGKEFDDTSNSGSTHLRSLAPKNCKPSKPTEVTNIEPEAVHQGFSIIRTASREGCHRVPEESAVDTLASEAFNDEPDRDIGYFGPTSNHAVFRSLSGVFARITSLRNCTSRFDHSVYGSDGDHETNNLASEDQTTQRQNERDKVDPFSLPNNKDLMDLVNRFSENIGMVFPFIVTSTLMEGVNQKNLRIKRALLNIVCAYAASSLQDSEVFYRRALNLLDECTLRGSSIELIQALLLLASYQQNNQRAVASWTYHALAVKAAYQLGLHSSRRHDSNRSSTVTELRQRLWQAVINQDRYLSIALGRPFLIPPQHFRVSRHPVTSDLSLICSATKSNILYFDHLTSLLAIQGSVVESTYEHNLEPDTDLSLDDLSLERLKLVVKLEQWRQNTSSFCGDLTELVEPDLCEAKRYKILLSIQYYRTVLLMNAPILVQVLEREVAKKGLEPATAIQEQVFSSIRSDLSAATMLQKVILNAARCGSRFIDGNATWWVCNYASFTAVLHLFGMFLACETCGLDALFEGRTRIDIRSALDAALETLRAIERTSLMSRKARQCIFKFLKVYDTLSLDQQNSTAAVDNNAQILDRSYSNQLAPDELDEDFFSSFVNQTADEFLFQCSDSAYLDTDFLFP